MPIVRTYMCGACGHTFKVTLSADQWDSPPPPCPTCLSMTKQEFKAPGIIGSHRAKAIELANKIAAEDYGVADLQPDNREGGRTKHRYKDQRDPAAMSAVGKAASAMMAAQNATLEQAIAVGRQTRAQFGGDGIDIIKNNLADGTWPDVLQASKARSMKIW